jgi:hypothetical protein
MAAPSVPDPLYRNFVWNNERWEGFELRDDDIIISTAPKCGTTWMQMQVALLVFRTPELPAPLATLSPWLDMNTRPVADVWADLGAQTHRRFIKTHTPLGGLPWREGVTYLHVGRDPRDAALSWDRHLANLDPERFMAARTAAVGVDDLPELGVDSPPPAPSDDPAVRFWAWMEGDPTTGAGSQLQGLVQHSQSFWDARPRPNVHLFHYSDQRADLTGQMARLADVLGERTPTEELVEAAGFETMKARADELAPNADTPFWVDNRQFFDQARSGGWQVLMGDDELLRSEPAVAAATDDAQLLTWLHSGWLG